MNPRIFGSINGYCLDNKQDKLVWEGSPDGLVTTSNFLKSFAPSMANLIQFKIIWQSWIPAKVSVFMWRLLHSALATQENIMKVGIPLASKCACCNRPGIETLNHLFLFSDLSNLVFSFICPIFRKSKPHSFQQLFFEWGFKADFTKFFDCLGFGIVICCFWDIWEHRNQLFYGDQAGSFNKNNILRWASFLSKAIKKPFILDSSSNLICKSLLISPDICKFRSLWSSWKPYQIGNTCNFAVIMNNSNSLLAAVVRNGSGLFIAGFKIATARKNFLSCLLLLIQEMHSHNIKFHCLKVSHPDISLLSRDSVVDWSSFRIKRQIVRCLQGHVVFKVCSSLNRPAEALCWARYNVFFSKNLEELPAAVRFAIGIDHIPHDVSFYEQRIYL